MRSYLALGAYYLFLFLPQFSEYRVVLQRARVLRRLLAAGDVAEQATHDLARARLGQGVGKADLIGSGQTADLLGDVLAQILFQFVAWYGSSFQRHKAADPLSLEFVRFAHHCSLGDPGMMDQRAFDLHGAQAMARHVEDVIDPAHDPKIAVAVFTGAVSREVAVRHLAPVLLTIAFIVAVNRAEHGRPRMLNDEKTPLVSRQRPSLLVHDLRDNSGKRPRG